MEEEKIFKAYERLLLRDLEQVKALLKEKEYDKAEKLIDDLIADTKQNIEE